MNNPLFDLVGRQLLLRMGFTPQQIEASLKAMRVQKQHLNHLQLDLLHPKVKLTCLHNLVKFVILPNQTRWLLL